METIAAPARLTDAEADLFCGKQVSNAAFDTLYRHSVRLVREDGSPLAVFVRGAVAPDIAEVAYRTLRTIKAPPLNRYTATFGGSMKPGLRRDGTRKKTAGSTELLRAAGMEGASSAIVGFMDRYTRLPFCRKTAFNMDHPELFESAMPFIRAANDVFAREVPERYAAQLAMIEKTSADFVIPGTAFTTITVNKNYPTRVHKDAGDLKEGFGCMAVLRAGHYSGGFFVMPKYRIAFDCGTGDVLLADVHEWHGNTRFSGVPGTYERVSCVFYYREKMASCGTAMQELERAQNRKPGDPLWDATTPTAS